DDAGGAEAALTRAGRGERVDPSRTRRVIEAFERRHLASREPLHWRDARDAGRTINPHRAAPTLSLRAAPVLCGRDAELVAQEVEQRSGFVAHGHRLTVDTQRDPNGHDREDRFGPWPPSPGGPSSSPRALSARASSSRRAAATTAHRP